MFKKLLACAFMLAAPGADANDLCGATIVENLKLEHDVICAGDALIVGADGIHVNLNGFTVMGSGGGVGIGVTDRTNVTIFGGTIRNFEAGVRTSRSSGVVIKHNTFIENREGVDLHQGSSGNTVRDNEFRSHIARGIMIRSVSTSHVLKGNVFRDERIGILIFAGVDNLVEHNVVWGATLAGIRLNVSATGNHVIKNAVIAGAAGIEFLLAPTGSAIGNTVSKNAIALNVCGVTGATAGNTLEKNLFVNNGADVCP